MKPTSRPRIERAKKGLPRSFWGHPKAKGLVADFDIRLNNSTLMAKVLVFKTTRDMKRFWREALGRPVAGALACCSSLYDTYERTDKKGNVIQKLVVDPKYYCIIGYNLKNLDCEVICHESVHAGYSYNERSRKPMPKSWNDLPEEGICYPAGAIMANTTQALRELKLIK